ncbi:acyltransferase family protein [Duganella callida]|uniref:Acyltransferase n=1 Tax=Duganella callida TaxID=2561932 RepID=A0A4Y9SFB3_9BURK|nr:acyltransferase [Duganella callida]TFW22240.1 acyltransferase [Duganella callida]
MTAAPRPPALQADAERLLFLDGLRALAALWVLLGHIYLTAIGWVAQDFWLARPLELLMYMHLGVDVFLVLSGYCLALPAARRGHRLPSGLADFFTARAFRILPPYFATLGLILLVNSFVPLASWGRNEAGLTQTLPPPVWWTNLLLLQDIYGQYNTINGPFWSVACEWHLYFTFPALLWTLRRHGVAALLALGACAAWALTTLSGLYPRLPLVDAAVPQPPYYILLFVLGIAAAALAQRPVARRCAWWAGAVLLLVLPALLWHYRIVDVPTMLRFARHHALIDSVTGAFTAALLLALSGVSPGHWLRRGLEADWLVRVGGYSYSLYLIHIPIVASLDYWLRLQPALQQWSPLSGFLLLAALAVPVCLGAARLFARLVERRIRWRPGSA